MLMWHTPLRQKHCRRLPSPRQWVLTVLLIWISLVEITGAEIDVLVGIGPSTAIVTAKKLAVRWRDERIITCWSSGRDRF